MQAERTGGTWPERDRRLEARMLCADLIDVCWSGEAGDERKTQANLEDISFSGAGLQVDAPVPVGVVVRIQHPKATLTGRVCYCVYRDTGYFLGVKFEPGYKWNKRRFRPKHLLDPRRLVALTLRRGLPGSEPDGSG